MRKLILLLGILLSLTILLSSSAIATWVYVTYIDQSYCSNPGNIDGAPDSNYASLGTENPSPTLGTIVCDLGKYNWMGPNQDFTVFADSSVEEDYDVLVAENSEDEGIPVGSGEDTDDYDFTTPSTSGKEWRYIILHGTSGVRGQMGGDYYYGPDIDAVGWDKP